MSSYPPVQAQPSFWERIRSIPFERWKALFKGNTLGRQLLNSVLPAVLSIVILMGVFSYVLVRRQILVSVQQEMNGLAQNTAMSLQAFFRQRSNDLESMSETPLIGYYCKNLRFGLGLEADLHRRAIRRYFTNFADRSKAYYDIFYVDANGRRVCSIRDGLPLEPPPEPFPLPSMLLLRQGKYLEPTLQRLVGGQVLVKRYAKPVFEDTLFLGSVVLDCDMRYVEEILGRLRIGKIGTAFIEDENAELILGLRSNFKHALIGLAPIPGLRWRVGVVARAEDFLEPLMHIQSLTVIFSVLACVVVVFLTLWRVLAFLDPIRHLVEATRRFGAGDLSHRIPQPRIEELKTLSAAFNSMAETLEQRTRELEQRVQQLTALRGMEEAVIQRMEEETILRTCLESVSTGFGFDRTAMYWVDYKEGTIIGRCLHGAESMGFSEANFRKRRIPLGGDDILNEVIRKRATMIMRDVGADPRLNKDYVAEAKTKEFVIAPICGKERVLGILTADNYYSGRELKNSDREGLSVFANAVGLALENSMLFQSLSESEARLRAVLENSPEAIIGLSREHWITTWNRGAEHIFGYTAADMVGKPLSALFPGDMDEGFRQMLNSVMEKGGLRDYSIKGMTKVGKTLDLSVSWGGAHGDFWVNREWAAVIRDVSEAKKLQQQLIRSEKLSAVGQLISGIAHELNNPLQAVVGYADLLTEEVKAGESDAGKKTEPVGAGTVLEDLRIITDNAMRCQKIIENLLLFVRQGEIEKRPIDVGKVAQAAMDLLHYKLKKAANVEVSVHVSPLLARVRGNFQQLQQIFVNLINNACDAMAGQAGPKIIKVTAVENNGVVKAEVADSGPGIPDTVRDRLFEPFFTTKAEGRGTGLGLAVCRQIIEDHGGRIGFRTEVGYGTTFWFEVPVANDDGKGSQSSVPAITPVRNKSVLVVDDEPDVLSFLSKVVESDGNMVEFAESLKEAAQKIASRSFDLVVADIRLGEGTGINLYENWPLWSKQPRPPFLFLTGDVVNSNLAQEIERKGLQILHKPIDLGSFQNAFRQLLTLKK